MQSLTTALENLLRHLSQDSGDTRHSGYRYSFPSQRRFDALSWLASQQVYPQFYWQQRNGDEEAAVLVRLPVLRRWTRHNVFFASTEHADLRI